MSFSKLVSYTLYVLVTCTILEYTEGVKRCYKCEKDCNGSLGKVEDCQPESGDSFKFACYKLDIGTSTFQRGCTRDFSEGESCVEEKGGRYCFCRTDECNATSPTRTTSSNFLILFNLLLFIIITFQRFRKL